MPTLKKPLAIRIDPAVLAAARACASRENRTLTNLIETVLRRHIEASGPGRETVAPSIRDPDHRA